MFNEFCCLHVNNKISIETGEWVQHIGSSIMKVLTLLVSFVSIKSIQVLVSVVKWIGFSITNYRYQHICFKTIK